jgi:hypothetical protein
MRKIIGVIFAFIGVAFIFSACGGETYADKLKKEEKAIKRFIDASGIEVINTYPYRHAFKDKEYFKDPNTGIYIHVIDSGTEDKITKGETVYMRFYDLKLLVSDPDTLITNDMQGVMDFCYMYMDYGNPGSYLYSNSSYIYTLSSQHFMYYYLSPGCALPLDYNLGNQAEVSLIVPFANGSYYQQSSYEPVYFGKLRYTIIPDEKPSGN